MAIYGNMTRLQGGASASSEEEDGSSNVATLTADASKDLEEALKELSENIDKQTSSRDGESVARPHDFTLAGSHTRKPPHQDD